MLEKEKEEKLFVREETTSPGEVGLELVGTILGGHYEILSILGRGGMSTVYKARHLLLDRIVAVKFVLPRLVHDPQTIMRFQQEARAATKLLHPNICGVKEFGLDEAGRAFLVMDFIEGTTLDKLFGKGKSADAARLLPLWLQICKGLQHAHEEGVIHRDLKPENIIVVRNRGGSEQAKILDFGIAKLLRDDEEGPNLTKTGDIFGTPSYMSPEQCLGKRVDTRSDIYSLGCLMYELLSGKPPYEAESSLEMLMRHVNDPAPNFDKGTVSKPLAQIIYCCLRKAPEERYQSVDELIMDLESVSRRSAPTNAESTSRRWRKERHGLPPVRIVTISLGIAVALSVTLLMSTLLAPALLPGGSTKISAQGLDSEAYQYFLKGDYKKAAPLLEFGVQEYIDRVEQTRKSGNEDALRAAQTLLAENYQNIGKCYLHNFEKAEAQGDTKEASESLEKALRAYDQSMEVWAAIKTSDFRRTMFPEAVKDFSRVLTRLGMTDRLDEIKDLAARKKVSY